MVGVLLLLGLVLLTPIGSGGLKSRPAHLADAHAGHANAGWAGQLPLPCTGRPLDACSGS